MRFFDNAGFEPVASESDAWNRGKYIVDGGGHCAACHSPRNALGAEVASAYLQGGNISDWYAPDLTPNPHVGLGGSSAQDIATYLKTGTDGVAVAAGPMAEAVEHSLQYLTDEDALAVGTYLTALSASDTPAPKAASLAETDMARLADVYEVNCSACHGLDGEGIEDMVPAFSANHGLLGDPTNMIHAMLKGTRAPHTHAAQTAAGMPSFAWKMDDTQVAEILTYVRKSFGNGAEAVSPEAVGEMRDALDAR
ncbi:c-type cytochrome [Salipiger mangrovisoli]|nr:c-type cytochrome [Salipiger mangrovisoli]